LFEGGVIRVGGESVTCIDNHRLVATGRDDLFDPKGYDDEPPA
jgi:hypothetical protein